MHAETSEQGYIKGGKSSEGLGSASKQVRYRNKAVAVLPSHELAGPSPKIETPQESANEYSVSIMRTF